MRVTMDSVKNRQNNNNSNKKQQYISPREENNVKYKTYNYPNTNRQINQSSITNQNQNLNYMSRTNQYQNYNYNQNKQQERIQVPQIFQRISSGGNNNNSRLPQSFKNALIQKSIIRISGQNQNQRRNSQPDSPRSGSHGNNQHQQQNYQNNNVFKSMVRGIIGMSKCTLCQIVPNSPLLSITGKCNHKFCLSCLTQYVTIKINMNQQVLCPQEQCDKLMDQQSKFFKDLPEKLKEKYQVNKLWRQNVNNPNVRLCPREQCKQGLVDLLASPPICRKCKRTFCKECQMEAHQGPCQDNFQNLFTQWKRCPKCLIFIQKIDGCNHMVCRCQHQFCYVCLANWNDEHYNCGNEDIQMDNYYYGENWEQDQNFQVPQNSLGKYICLIIHIISLPFIIIFVVIGALLAMIGGIAIGILKSPYTFCKQARGPMVLCLIPLFPCVLLSGFAEGAQDGLDQFCHHTDSVICKHCSRIIKISDSL